MASSLLPKWIETLENHKSGILEWKINCKIGVKYFPPSFSPHPPNFHFIFRVGPNTPNHYTSVMAIVAIAGLMESTCKIEAKRMW